MRCEVHVDESVLLSRVPVDLLLEECRLRLTCGIDAKLPAAAFDDIARELRAAFVARDRTHFEILLMRLRPFEIDGAADEYLRGVMRAGAEEDQCVST